MSQLNKVVKGMSCFGERRARGAGSIYLADGKTVCPSVTCDEGMLVKVESNLYILYIYNIMCIIIMCVCVMLGCNVL